MSAPEHLIHPLSEDAAAILSLMTLGRRSFSVTVTASRNGYTVKIGRVAMGHGATITQARDAAMLRLNGKIEAMERDIKTVEKVEL